MMLERFLQLRADHVALAPFASGVALLDFLARPSRDLDETDRIYAALVRAAQVRTRTAQVAHTLLLCGLWPGLDRFYRHRVARFRDTPDELTVTISGVFTLLVARIDLRDVHRVAATLVRNTRREATAALRRAQEEHPGRVDDRPGPLAAYDEVAFLFEVRREEEAPDSEALAGPRNTVPMLLEMLPDLQSADEAFRLELLRLHRVLRRILQEDTELILGVLVLEETQEQAATRLQITPSAARKRVQRMLARLRAELDSQDLGHSPEK